MATNRKFHASRILSVVCSNPTTPASGDPVRWGNRIGTALTDENAAGLTTVDFGGVYNHSVKGVGDGGNSAVSDGDAIFYVDADTPKLSKKASGYFVGFANATVGSGSTGTIAVAMVDSPGSGTLTSGGVGATQLASDSVTTVKIADANVTAAKLGTNLQIGFVPLPLTAFRLVATNDIAAKNAADGGTISLDTDPTLKRVNGATDKQLRIAWAATSVVEITQDFVYPPDLDDTAAVVVHLFTGMAGATDTPVLGVGYFEGVGDTNAGGNTAALAATAADKTVTIAAGDVGAYPKVASISIIPAAHATDAIYLYGAWISYTRKS